MGMTPTTPCDADAVMPSVSANPSSSFQLKEAGYSDVGANTAIQTMILCHMRAVTMAVLVMCSTVHGSATVATHGVSISR